MSDDKTPDKTPVKKDDVRSEKKAAPRPLGSVRKRLTPFICQELLYDFALGTLDADRTSAVEEFLKNDADCRSSLEFIRAGLAYGQQLNTLVLRPDVLYKLRAAESVVTIGKKYASWRGWPSELKWSIGLIAISLVMAGLISLVPWSKLEAIRHTNSGQHADSIELAQLQHLAESQLEVAQEHQEGDSVTEPEGSGDEEGDGDEAVPAIAAKGAAGSTGTSAASVPSMTSVPPAATVTASQAPVAAVARTPAVVAQTTPVPKSQATPGKAVAAAPSVTAVLPTAVPKPPETVAGKTPESAAASASNNIAATGKDADDGKKKGDVKGFVFRAFMTLGNLEEIAPQITDTIVELGGSKAGEVELGWRRGTGRYFHFSLPEANQEKLMEKLHAYGPVRISKDPHSRVMPEGQVRFILWIEAPVANK